MVHITNDASIDVYSKEEDRVIASFHFSSENKFSRLIACNRAGFFVESILKTCGYDASRFLLYDTFDKFFWSL